MALSVSAGGKRDPSKPTPGEMLMLRRLASADPAAAGPAWRALSESYTAVAADRTAGKPLTVMVAPGAAAGHPGLHAPKAARIMLEGNLLPVAPDQIDPASDPEHFKALAKLHGVLIHECGHANHTLESWKRPADDQNRFDAETLLEEIRMEAQAIRDRASDQRWLQVSAQEIILGTGGGNALGKHDFDSAHGAISAAVLVEGRVDAGTLNAGDVAPVAAKIAAALDPKVHAAIRQINAEAVALADDDHLGLSALGKRLAALFPADDGSGGGCKGLTQAIADATGAAAQKALDEMDGEGGREELEELVGDANARKEIAKALEEGARNTMGGAGGVSPEKGEREPTDEERTARNRLSEELKKVRWRDRHTIKRNNLMPPGRLRSREALRRSAEIASGKMVTAQPWKQRRRRHVDLPKLTCGILIDTSGSMSYAHDMISSSLWVLSNAVHDNGGKVAGALFGDTAEVVLPPEAPPRFVIDIEPSGGTEHVPDGIELLGDLLAWKREEGPRLLVIVSDGFWADEVESQGSIALAREQGITVIQVGVGMIPPDHGADQIVEINEPLDLATVVGKTAADELKLW